MHGGFEMGAASRLIPSPFVLVDQLLTSPLALLGFCCYDNEEPLTQDGGQSRCKLEILHARSAMDAPLVGAQWMHLR